MFAAGGAARRNPHAALGKGQYRHHDLSPSILIEVDEMLNAVLVGLDRGKGVTIPTCQVSPPGEHMRNGGAI